MHRLAAVVPIENRLELGHEFLVMGECTGTDDDGLGVYFNFAAGILGQYAGDGGSQTGAIFAGDIDQDDFAQGSVSGTASRAAAC